MAHFFLYTGPGLLVLTVGVSAVVACVVWYAVTVAVTLIALALWRLRCALRVPPLARGYTPGGNA